MANNQTTTRQHTTSIVDISEIEDDEAPLTIQAAHNNNQQQQQTANGGQQSRPIAATSNQQQQQQQQHNHLYLYHEDSNPLQRIPNLLSTMINPSQQQNASSNPPSPGQTLLRPLVGQAAIGGGQLPALDYHPHQDVFSGTNSSRPDSAFDPEQQQQRPTTPGARSQAGGTGTGTGLGTQQGADEQSKANLGTLSGVYFPCVQNIFGVILFIRMVWIVGTAGVPAAFALVFICCCVTLTTSISLSAIATNGIVPAGGSYFMISRSLGPECGGAVGTMFFLGTTFAGAMYITGAVEIMLNYLAPSWGLFGDFQKDINIMYNNIRVYGTLLLIIVGFLVWIGMRFVSKLAPIALFCVLISIASIYTGIFINYQGRPDLMICVLGDRLVSLKNIPYDDPSLPMMGAQMDLPDQSNSFSSLALPGGGRNGSRAMSANELATYREMRRTKALCTYEKLRYIYCPNELARGKLRRNQQQQQQSASDTTDSSVAYDTNNGQSSMDQQQSSSSSSLGNGGNGGGNAPEISETEQMKEIFKYAPNMSNCDAYFRTNKDRIHLEKAVPGIASGVLFQNLKPRFREKKTLVSYDDGINQNPEGNTFNSIMVDITTSFTILISIYFPSCTGILAGSNRSGDLADAQKSIPRGTIAAQLTTSCVYLSCIVLFGSTFNNLFIRDKFGESMGGQLAVTQIAWPHPYIILLGGLLSTLGAALQSLVGAPRILQGIAKDEVIPCFNRFAKLSSRGEPETAIFFTLGIAWLAVLIGNLDFIAPILTLSLVMCYFFINLACTLHSLLGAPNWRPRFKYYHWSISSLGCILCLFVMIVSSWIYFLIAIFLAGCIYKYIEFSGAEKEWGDGKQGLALSAARYNLLRLKTSEPHTKNWRPQLLLFCKLKPAIEMEPQSALASGSSKLHHHRAAAAAAIMAAGHHHHPHHHPMALALGNSSSSTEAAADSSQKYHTAAGGIGLEHLDNVAAAAVAEQCLRVAHPKLLTFASQLKAGKGLTLVSSIIEGDFKRRAAQAAKARQSLQESMQEEKVKGFADVLVAPSIMDGLSYQIQTAGLGGLKHNTVIVAWPDHWRRPMSYTAAGHLAGGRPRPPTSQEATATTPTSNQQQQRTGSFKQTTNKQQQQQFQQETTRNRAHLFIELMRNVQVSQNALLVLKGVDSWPESCDKLGGFIDIWWIVNDGGLLMLLPHLLRQHRTWKSCQLRIFTVAQANDNSVQMRDDLRKFLYHLRIEAQVDIVEMNSAEVSDYAYERTLMMEQRTEIMKRLNVNHRKQSLLLEQEVDGRLIKFRIRKPSMGDFEDCASSSSGAAAAGQQQIIQPPATLNENYPLVEMQSSLDNQPNSGAQSPGEQQQQQPSGAGANGIGGGGADGSGTRTTSGNGPGLAGMRPDEENVRRMHTALSLNEAILKRSKSAKLVIINLPGAPKSPTPEAENNYMEFVEIITDKLERVLMVQNGGREVITIHS